MQAVFFLYVVNQDRDPKEINMGLSGISPLSLLLILLIVVVLFGTKKLKNIGADLGQAVKQFRQSLNTDDNDKLS